MTTRRLFTVALGTLAAIGMALLTPPDVRPRTQAAIKKDKLPATLFQAPLYFEPNQGQAPPKAQFVSRAPGVSLELREGGVQLVLTRSDAPSSRLALAWVGGRAHAQATAGERLTGTVNYLRGRDPSKWVRHVPTFRGVRYAEIYRGIDIAFYGNPQRLEYDFLVDPGASPEDIRLSFDGSERATVEPETGDLLLHVDGRQIRQHAPVAYQNLPARMRVDAHYRLNEDGTVGLSVGDWDRSKALVIDPVLDWSTYLGGMGRDWVNGVGVNGNGDVVLVGAAETASSWGLLPKKFDHDNGPDAFLSRFSATGTHLSTTFFGGDDGEEAFDVAFDAQHNIYLTGTTTSLTFPTTGNAFMKVSDSLDVAFRVGVPKLNILEWTFDPFPVGDADAFLTKLDPGGSELLYSTYLGGSPDIGLKLGNKGASTKIGAQFQFHPGAEIGRSIAVTPSGEAYVVGFTNSAAFPVTMSAFKTELNDLFGHSDAFLTKIDTHKSGIASARFSTYLGGTCNETATGVALDAHMNVYVTGETDTFFLCGGFTAAKWYSPPPVAFSGTVRAFLLKLTGDDTPGVWFSTTIGPTADVHGGDVVVDHDDNAHVTMTSWGPGTLYAAAIESDGDEQMWLKDLGVSRSYDNELGQIAKPFNHGLASAIAGNTTRIHVVRNSPVGGPRLHEVVLPGSDWTESSLGLGTGKVAVLAATSTPRRIVAAGAVDGSDLNTENPEQPENYDGVDGFASAIIHNPPPVLSAGQVSPQVEGSQFLATVATYTRTSSAPTGLTARVDWGDGSGETVANVVAEQQGSIKIPHTYRDNGNFTGRACISEGLELIACLPFAVAVANVSPTVKLAQAILGPGSPGALYDGMPDGSIRVRFGVVAAFTDPGILDTHTATIRWSAGGAAEPAPVSPFSRSVIDAEHVFPPGTNPGGSTPIQICVTDKDGGIGCASATLELPQANLSIERFGPQNALECSIVDYRVVVTNNGPSTATNVIIRDELPAGLPMTYLGSLVIGGTDATVTEGQHLDITQNLGEAVAIEGNRAVVTGQGFGARVYERNLQTSQWQRVANLVSSSHAKVALRGDWVLLSKFAEDEAGSVQVWRKQQGTWSLSQTITPPDGTASGREWFGAAIAVSDNTIAVGDPAQGSSNGAVYLYRFNGTDWSFDHKIGGIGGGRFGQSVALTRDGRFVAVGAPGENYFDNSVNGAVYVYRRTTGTGDWVSDAPTVKPALTPNDAHEDRSQDFGWSVALSEDNTHPFLLVGAPRDPGLSPRSSGVSSGAAYVFQREGVDDWSQKAKLLPNNPGQDLRFGNAVAVSANRALVGVGSETLARKPSQDWAYLFGSGPTKPWQFLARLRPEQVQAGDEFGEAVALSGADVLVGTSDGNTAYVFPTCLQPDGPGSLQCNVGSLASGESAEFLVQVKLGAGIAESTPVSVTSTARAFSGAVDSSFPNTDSATTIVSDGQCDTEADVTPPMIEPTVSGTPGKNGWYVGGPVAVMWNVVDLESTFVSSGCEAASIAGDTNGTTLTCTASSPGGTSTRSVTIRRDTKLPVITPAVSPVLDAGTGNLSYDVTFSCIDPPASNGASSGVVSCPGPGVSYAGGTVSQTIEDVAGNTATVTATIPYARAGADQYLEALAGCGTPVMLSAAGSFFPGGGAVSFEWRRDGALLASGHDATVTLPVGIHEIQLVARRGVVFAVDTVRVEVVDLTPPVFTFVPAAIVTDATGERTLVQLPTATIIDACPLTLTVEAPDNGFLQGDTTVLYRAVDSSGNAATATTRVTVRPRVDVGIAVAESATLIAGTGTPFSIAVSNTGPSRATGVVVRPALPIGVTPVKIATGEESCTADAEGNPVCTPISLYSVDAVCGLDEEGFSCLVPGIDSSASVTFSLAFETSVSAGGQHVATFAASAREEDTNNSNDMATTTLDVLRSADVTLAFSGPGAVTAGKSAFYTGAVENHGPSSALGVSAKVSLANVSPVLPLPSACAIVPASGEQAAFISCAVGDLLPGARIELNPIALMVPPAARGTLVVAAVATSADSDPIPGNNTADATVPIVVEADLSMTLTKLTGDPIAGTDLNYRLDVANGGSSDTDHVEVRLQFPQTLSVTSDRCVPSASPGAGLAALMCAIGALRSGGSTSLPLDVHIDEFARGGVTLTAEVSGPDPDPDGGNNHQTVALAIAARADVAITVTPTPNPAVAGSALTYTFDIVNHGPSGATALALTAPVPEHTTFVSASEGCVAGEAILNCNLPQLSTGGHLTISMTVEIDPAARTALEGVAVLSSPDDEMTGNNAADLHVEVTAIADLRLSLSSAAGTVIAGRALGYTVAVVNDGPSSGRAVTVTIPLPIGSFASDLAMGCALTDGGAAVRCDVGELTPGASRDIPIAITVGGFARDHFEMTATVAATETDTNHDNNTQVLSVAVTALVDVAMDLMASTDPAIAGTFFTYTMWVSNIGPSGATGVSASLTLPTGVATGGLPAGCVEASQVVTCTVANVAADDHTTVNITVVVDQFTRDPLQASAAASGAEADSDPDNGFASLTTPVSTSAEVHISASAAPHLVVAGNFLTYTVDVTNGGPSGAIGATLTHALPPGVMFVSATPSTGCTHANGLISCALANLAAGETTHLKVVSVPSAAGLITATSSILLVENDPDASNNTVETTTQASSPAGGPAGAGDFDGDGDLDLAVADEKNDMTRIFRNNGLGAFTQIQQVAVGEKPKALAIGDLDGDGRVDIAVANWGSDDVSLLRNTGVGLFAETERPGTTGARPIAIAAGDFDGDGRLDLAVAHEHSDSVSIVKHAGSGGWMEQSSIGVAATNGARHPSAIAAGDLDGDGRLDLVVTNNVMGSLSVLDNLGEGAFALQQEVALSFADHPAAVAVGDYDGDGDLDLAVVGGVHDTVSILHNAAGALIENSGGIAVGHKPAAIATGDLTGDGRLDLAVANANGNSVSALVNAGSTFPVSLASMVGAGEKPIAVMAGDVNGDRTLDLVVVNAQSIVTVLLNVMTP